MINKSQRIYVAGHSGLVGSAFIRQLINRGYNNIITRSHKELDLMNQDSVEEFFIKEKPDIVIDAAAKVGGIKANSEYMTEFFYENMQIEQNIIMSAFRNGVNQLLFLGSSCMYPTHSEQPMKESYILTGIPEPTNEGYALAKICGSRLCSYLFRQYGVNYISAIPANAYGIGDSFDLKNSHVIPALLRRFHEAKKNNKESITLWGSGNALREFIYTDDLADAGIFLLNNYSSDNPINIGTGEEVSMLELAEIIKSITGFSGSIITDPTKPDGMMRRLCDSSKISSLGWKYHVSLKDGIRKLYEWYLKNESKWTKI